MRGFHLLVMLVIGDRIKDTQCGFKVVTIRCAGDTCCLALLRYVACICGDYTPAAAC